VAVPDVVGSAQANAVQALAGVGLKPGKITSQQTTVAPPDEVASQKPPAGTLVKPGSLVDLVVAEAPVIGTPVKVPAIVGLDYKVAAKKLAEAGLSYKALYDSASDRPQGSIVSQDPEAGQTVPKGTVVGVTISLSAVPPKP
jgi:serine/threonine-protein kinase